MHFFQTTQFLNLFHITNLVMAEINHLQIFKPRYIFNCMYRIMRQIHLDHLQKLFLFTFHPIKKHNVLTEKIHFVIFDCFLSAFEICRKQLLLNCHLIHLNYKFYQNTTESFSIFSLLNCPSFPSLPSDFSQLGLYLSSIVLPKLDHKCNDLLMIIRTESRQCNSNLQSDHIFLSKCTLPLFCYKFLSFSCQFV